MNRGKGGERRSPDDRDLNASVKGSRGSGIYGSYFVRAMGLEEPRMEYMGSEGREKRLGGCGGSTRVNAEPNVNFRNDD